VETGTGFLKPCGTAGSDGGIQALVAGGQDNSGQRAEGGRGGDGQDDARPKMRKIPEADSDQ